MSLSCSITGKPEMHDHPSSLPSFSFSQSSTRSLSDDQIFLFFFFLQALNIFSREDLAWENRIYHMIEHVLGGNGYFSPSLLLFSSLCASAITYVVAIVLCQRNERAGTSLGAGSCTLSPWNVLIILHRHTRAEKVAHTPERTTAAARRT